MTHNVGAAVSIQDAISVYEAGELSKAEQICRRLLRNAPAEARPDFLNLLGIIDFKRGSYDSAIASLAEAVRLEPAVPDFHLNLGNVYGSAEKVPESIACFQAALSLDPGCHEAYSGLGFSLCQE